MRRQAIALLTALTLSASLAACSDDDPEPDNESDTPVAQARDSHETSRLAATEGEATGPDAPQGVADIAPGLVARSARLEAEGVLADEVICYYVPDPKPSDLVDCADAHGMELYGSLPLDDSWPDDYDAYEAGTKTGDLWQAWALRGCSALQMEANGSEGLGNAVGGTVFPGAFAVSGFVSPSRAAWEAGDRNTYCVVYTTEGRTASEVWTPLLLSADRPDELGLCKGYGDGTWPVVPCSEQHWREEIFFVNAPDVLDQAFIDSVDPTAVTDEQWAAMDAVCDSGRAEVIGADRDDLVFYSDVHEGWWGDTAGWYPINCGLVPADSSLDMVGSAIGVGDGDIELVPTEIPAA